MVLSTFYRWINRSQPLLVVSPPGQLSPEMWPLELDLKQRGEETATRKKPVRMCCSNPVPSGWVMKHVVDVNHFSAWQPPTSYCLPFVPKLPFWRVPTLYGSGEKGNCYLLHHRCLFGISSPSPPPPPQPCAALSGREKRLWVRLSQTNVCSQNSWAREKSMGRLGVTLLTAVQVVCRAARPGRGPEVLHLCCLSSGDFGGFPFFKAVLQLLSDFVSPK